MHDGDIIKSKREKTAVRPQITVAAVVELEGQFLMVEEKVNGRTVYNQPAGHLEAGESLYAAVCREVLEETCLRFAPEFVVGLYQWRHWLRVAFGGRANPKPVKGRQLDDDIVAAHWLELKQIQRLPRRQMRSPLVIAAIEDYRRGQHHPLSCLRCLSEEKNCL